MTPEKIVSVAAKYCAEFQKKGIGKRRVDIRRPFSSFSQHERLAHTHFLADGIITQHSQDPGKLGKMNRHLSVVQTILNYEGWYTIFECMEHNKPD